MKRPSKKLFLATVAAVALVLLVLVICVYSGVFSSNNPLDKKLDMDTYRQDMELALEGLSAEDRAALLTGLMRSCYNREEIDGKTFRDFLEAGRRMEKEFMDTVARDMDEFFVRDSLQKDSLRRAEPGKGK